MSSIQQYRQDFIAVLLRWSLIIVAFCTCVFLWAYWREPLWTSAVLLITFAQFLPLGGYCFWLLHHSKSHQATWIYIVSALIATTTFTIFMPDIFLLVGIIGYILFVRIIMFLETRRAAYVLGLICLFLYLLAILIRIAFTLPEIDFGATASLFLYVLPLLILILFTMLDQVGTYYLHNALEASEQAREELVNSYEELADSQKALSNLALKLEGSNQELTQVNEELKSFVYIISHDLRAPLLNLKGFSAELRDAITVIEPTTKELLPQMRNDQQERARLALEEDIPVSLTFIESSVTRMDGLINALLKLSRYGHRELYFTTTNMNEVMEKVLYTLAHQLTEKGIEGCVEPLPEITADYLSMEQIMSNLISNAINYLDPQRPGKIDVWAEENDLETVFHIRDNGRGIAEQDMPKLFEPFRRIGNNKIPGEGMGLAYVQTLVRRHNGRIWCNSEVDIGTTFSFTIAKQLIQNE
jgi:signal transduction histidine kinase